MHRKIGGVQLKVDCDQNDPSCNFWFKTEDFYTALRKEAPLSIMQLFVHMVKYPNYKISTSHVLLQTIFLDQTKQLN